MALSGLDATAGKANGVKEDEPSAGAVRLPWGRSGSPIDQVRPGSMPESVWVKVARSCGQIRSPQDASAKQVFKNRLTPRWQVREPGTADQSTGKRVWCSVPA